LVARMDTDDISLPRRFEKQVAFMESNHDIAASSAVLEEWDETFSRYNGERVLPNDMKEINKFSKYRNPLSHPVVIFRKSIVISVGGYPVLRGYEDYLLWSLLLIKGYKIANLPDVLLKQRAGNQMINRRGSVPLKIELKALKYQHSIKFLNWYELFRNIIIRFLIRIPPGFIKKYFYKHRDIKKYQFLIAFIDVILLMLAFFLSFWIRYMEIPTADILLRVNPHFVPIIITWITGFKIAGFYSLRIPRMGHKLFSNLLIIAVICTLLSFAYFYLDIGFVKGPRTILLIYGIIAVFFIALWRLGLNRIARKFLAKINIAFIGCNDAVLELVENMKKIKNTTHNTVCIFNENITMIDEFCNVPVINDKDAFLDKIVNNKVQMIILEDGIKYTKAIHDILFELGVRKIEFISVNDFYETIMRRIPVKTLDDLKNLKNTYFQTRIIYKPIKQVIDIVLALLLFIITLPLWPFIIINKKSKGLKPLFVKQERIGYLGRPFNIIRFNNDGKNIIDKMPQLINIIKSDMSFVGPSPDRPELIQEFESEVPFYRQRLLVKPGLSGWEKISGECNSASKENVQKKLQYDFYYIKNMSFFLDVSIFFKALTLMFKKKSET